MIFILKHKNQGFPRPAFDVLRGCFWKVRSKNLIRVIVWLWGFVFQVFWCYRLKIWLGLFSRIANSSFSFRSKEGYWERYDIYVGSMLKHPTGYYSFCILTKSMTKNNRLTKPHCLSKCSSYYLRNYYFFVQGEKKVPCSHQKARKWSNYHFEVQ